MQHLNELLVYTENKAMQKILQGVRTRTSDKISPTVDIVISNARPGGIAHLKIPSAPVSAQNLLGKIIQTANFFEESVMARLGVHGASWHGRRILVWLYQAGATGITPKDLENRIGGSAARNTLRTTVHSLRRLAAPRELIIFENGVYKLAQL